MTDSNGRWKIAEAGVAILVGILIAALGFLWANDQRLSDKIERLQDKVNKIACKGHES